MENGDSKDHYFYTSKLEKLKQVSLSSITYLDSRELIFMKVLHEISGIQFFILRGI